jgi:predicted MFS family arabinose efflux permease
MSAQNIVFAFGPRDVMAMRLSLSISAVSGLAGVGRLGGGVIAAAFGYAAVFSVTMAFLVLALALMLLRVEEPRKRKAAG